MKILLIEQIKTKKTTYKPFEKTLLTTFSILPTLYVRRIAAITPKKHNIKVLNERYEPIEYSSNYDVVIIHFSTTSAKRAYEIADEFRNKNVKVVLIGLHVSALPEEALQHADSIIQGRGEVNWLSFLKDFETDKIKKIYPPLPYDELSCRIPPTLVSLPGFIMVGAIEATRGCPINCNFCPESNTPNGNNYYTRPIDQVIEELKKIPQKIIMFYDASLTINPSYTKELFKKMIPLKKKFFLNGNVNVLADDEELVKLSKKAGCIAWLIGFESVSQETINSIGKNTNKVSIYKKAVDQIHKNKMAVIGDFMFGFDNDTNDVFKSTLNAIKDLKLDVADFTIVTPFPGTPLFKQLDKEERLLTKEWKNYSMYNVVFKPKNMTPEELINGVYFIYKNFYRPSESIKRIIRSLKYGIIPFFSVMARNIITTMGSTRIKKN
jgi:radical SAM superfamily enzyme YgiQ (UPF0313 family)